MQPRNLHVHVPRLPFYVTALLFSLINFCFSAAPADLPDNCPMFVPTTERVLLDSCCYSTLLPGENSTWVTVSENSNDGTVSTASCMCC